MSAIPFGRYQLVELLGRGGMGEVWRAHDTAIDRMVAIKMLLPHFAQDHTFEKRFRREARAAARLDDPHVVPIYDFGEIDTRLYVTMRLVKGSDLQTLLKGGPLEPGRAVAIIEQVAAALHAAHEAGLVHRDVKPSNVLVTNSWFVYLIDFGIARVAGESSVTTTGATIGTWAYMAPERFRSGAVEPSSDIYALACMLHQSLTGQLPFPGTTLEQVAMAHMVDPPPKPSTQRRGIPTAMDEVVARGLAKNPDQRYGTALDLAAAARHALSSGANPQSLVKAPLPDHKAVKKTPVSKKVRSKRSSASSAERVVSKPSSRPAAKRVESKPPSAPTPEKGVSKPSSAYRQLFTPMPGAWVKVVAAGDNHYGQVGRIVEVCEEEDEDDDDLDVIVAFPGERHAYAYRRIELTPTSAPAQDIVVSSSSIREDFWANVGIDPIRIVTSSHDYLTLRCYLDGAPIFLGADGMINVFASRRALRRYLAGNPRNDMSSLITYSDVTAAAIERSLPLREVTEGNIYVLSGLANDIGDGPAHIDRMQLELAVELISDVAEYVGSSLVKGFLRQGQPLGDLVHSVLGKRARPGARQARVYAARLQWTQLEDFLESRLRVKRW